VGHETLAGRRRITARGEGRVTTVSERRAPVADSPVALPRRPVRPTTGGVAGPPAEQPPSPLAYGDRHGDDQLLARAPAPLWA